MNATDLARVQFATTTLFHFFFVPITIGLFWLTAFMQTAWRRTGNETWLRLTRFMGKLLLINVAIGVATGLVQEFEFGMNWSTYARFVGDVFGAPLAIEGLAAFFLESTFLGIWIFGWNKLKPRVHLATIYLAAVGSTLSAVFIIAANSWMQHPVGYTINPTTGHAELDSIGAVFTNPIFLWAIGHTIFASFVAGGCILLSVACWHLKKGREVDAFRRAATLALVVLFPTTGLALMTGARLAVTVTQLQPMKTASFEALWNSEGPAGFSIVQFGGMTADDQTPSFDIEVPHLLSILATNTWDGEVQGINQSQTSEQQQYGPGNYIPVVYFTYWGLRVMAYVGSLVLVISGIGLFLVWRKKLATSRWFQRVGVWTVLAPFLINAGGWILAETGRQPWIVWGLQPTGQAASPSVSAAQVGFTLGGFIGLYVILGVVDGWLMVRASRRDLDDVPAEWGLDDDPDDDHDDDDKPDRDTPTKIPALSY
jgi:cytochrome d ubiquinol oxidase subunit I